MQFDFSSQSWLTFITSRYLALLLSSGEPGGGGGWVWGFLHASFSFTCSADALNLRSPAALVSYRPDSPSISRCRSSSMHPRNSRVIHLSPADNKSGSLPLSSFLFFFIYLRKCMANLILVQLKQDSCCYDGLIFKLCVIIIIQSSFLLME